MEKTLDVIMEKNSLEEKTSLSTQVGAPGPAGWASPPPTGGGTCSGPATGMDTTITTETSQMGLFACLTGCRRTSDGTNVAAGTGATGASIEGQAAAAVVTALREARGPGDEQPRGKRCDVISSRKRISTSGLRDLRITNG